MNGIPSKNEIPANIWILFSFEVLRKADLVITLTPYAGRPNLFVTAIKNLTNDNFLWQEYWIQDTLSLLISKDDPNFKIGTYYIVIQSYESSSFSLIAHTSDTPISLIDGWPTTYNIRNEYDFVDFRFTASTGRMIFCNLKAGGTYRPTVFTRFQEVNQAYQAATNTTHDSNYGLGHYNNKYGSMSLVLPHDTIKKRLNLGIYSPTAANSTKTGTFTIYCSSSALTTLLRIGTTNIEVLDEDVKRRRYEMVTETKGTLDAYVIPCNGEFKLEISSNWTIINQEAPDVSLNRLTDGVIEGSISNANGRYFISVSTLTDIPGQSQIYELLTVFTKAGDPIHKRAIPGKNGILTWTSNNPDHITVSWNPVENDDRTVIKDTDIEYKVYFTKDKHTRMISACGIHHFESQNEIFLLGSTTENSLEVEVPENKGFINVIAVLSGKNPSPLKEIIYDPTEIMLMTPPQPGALLIFWVLATLLFLAVTTSIYFYRKKKRAEQNLAYEMSDLRHIASVTSIDKDPSKRKDRYAPLSNPN